MYTLTKLVLCAWFHYLLDKHFVYLELLPSTSFYKITIIIFDSIILLNENTVSEIIDHFKTKQYCNGINGKILDKPLCSYNNTIMLQQILGVPLPNMIQNNRYLQLYNLLCSV